jgi:hypothetical protein
VYIAVDNSQRGRFGKQLIQKQHQLLKGNIALHVEPDNPKQNYMKTGIY